MVHRSQDGRTWHSVLHHLVPPSHYADAWLGNLHALNSQGISMCANPSEPICLQHILKQPAGLLEGHCHPAPANAENAPHLSPAYSYNGKNKTKHCFLQSCGYHLGAHLQTTRSDMRIRSCSKWSQRSPREDSFEMKFKDRTLLHIRFKIIGKKYQENKK